MGDRLNGLGVKRVVVQLWIGPPCGSAAALCREGQSGGGETVSGKRRTYRDAARAEMLARRRENFILVGLTEKAFFLFGCSMEMELNKQDRESFPDRMLLHVVVHLEKLGVPQSFYMRRKQAPP